MSDAQVVRPPAPFVIGVSRSGTTLLRLMLDAHPDLAVPEETHFLGGLVDRPPGALSVDQVVDVMVASPAWPNLHVDVGDLRLAVADCEPFAVGDAVRAFYRLSAARQGKRRWGDKTPPYREHVEGIARLLPEAHVVHIIRDGRDVAVSLRDLWFGPGADPVAAATAWVAQVRGAREAGARVDHYHEVRYEQLVADPEPVLRDLCRFLDLPFAPAMLVHHRTADERLADIRVPPAPPGQEPVDLDRFLALHERARRPPDPSRIGRWRTEMAPVDVAAFEAVAGPLLTELGYATATTRTSVHSRPATPSPAPRSPVARLTIRNPTGEYRDGGEAALLAVIGRAQDRSTGSDELVGAIEGWVSRYHLSPQRPNVLRPLTIGPGARILEVGAGTGVLTRWLGDRGHHLVAVEPTLARAEVVAARCADLERVEVIAGTVADVGVDEAFDLVLLVGVLEYAGVGGLPDADALLAACAERVAPDGALVVAIENRFGLQYLAGADEDHRAVPGVGVEGYVRPGPQTYDRRTLGTLVEAHGLGAQRWLFPFPDYKLPSSVLAERAFDTLAPEDVAALARRLRSPHLGGALAFDLRDALVAATRAGIGTDLANSFLLVASASPAAVDGIVEPDALAWLFGDERRVAWSRARTVRASPDGLVVVEAAPVAPRRVDWLAQHVVPERPFVAGPTLADLALAACRRADGPALDGALARWVDALDAGVVDGEGPDGAGEHPFRPEPGRRLLPADRLDVELGNFVIGADGVVTYIDDEWVAASPVDRDLVALRALWALALTIVERDIGFPGAPGDTVDDLALDLAARAGLDADHDLLERFTHAEAELQRLVVFTADDEILARLDGSRTRRDRVVARTATASRLHEALLDAWADVAAARDERDRLRRDADALLVDAADARREIERLTRDWYAHRAALANLEEQLALVPVPEPLNAASLTCWTRRSGADAGSGARGVGIGPGGTSREDGPHDP